VGVHLQDDAFLDRELWDFEHTPAEHYPLLLHYHPLVIYRHQVIKQADLVLATFLVGHAFSPDEKRRIFDYYDPLTTGDSSLSGCIQSIMATELGYDDRAYRYFADAVAMDLGDIGGNVRDGLHVSSLGGTWLALVYGFAGLRDRNGELRFRPRLPDGWSRLRFRLRLRESDLEVDVRPEETRYRLLRGKEMRIWHGEKPLDLQPDAAASAAGPG
jgi:alpha,alpha-trehalose phosphorylase